MAVTIRGYDVHCALGRGVELCVQQLQRGGVTPTMRRFDRLREPLELPWLTMPGEAADLYQYLGEVTEQLLQKSGLSSAERRRTAILLGSSSFDVQVSEERYHADFAQRGEAAVSMPIVGYGKLANRLAQTLQLSDCHYTYSTACTSSANALLYGQRLIEAGRVDHALVVGLEWRNHTSILGFQGLGLISPSGAMNSFDSNRDGLILGEGVGAIVLSRAPAAHLPLLIGGAIGTDNHSLTAANTDGLQLSRVITRALRDSGITAKQLVAVKAHATASLKNDEAEAAALRRVLGEQLPPVFALKPLCGHTLGASGALELALTLACLATGQLPTNPKARNDGGLGVQLQRQPLPAPAGDYLFNCFAFGGNNNAMVIRHPGQGVAA